MNIPVEFAFAITIIYCSGVGKRARGAFLAVLAGPGEEVAVRDEPRLSLTLLHADCLMQYSTTYSTV